MSAVLISAHELVLYFLSHVQLRKGVIERLWWAPGIQSGSTHPSQKNTENDCIKKVTNKSMNS